MDSTQAVYAKRLAEKYRDVKSIEIRVDTRIEAVSTASGTGSRAFDHYTEHYIETSTEGRYLESTSLLGEKPIGRSAHYGDGKRFTDVTFSKDDLSVQDVVAIERSFHRESDTDHKEMPYPIRYLCVGHEPLYEAVMKATPRGESEVMGRKCDRFLFPKGTNGSRGEQVYDLDQSTGIPLRYGLYASIEAVEGDKPALTWVAEEVGEYQGRPVVTKSTATGFSPSGEPAYRWVSSVQSVVLTRSIPRHSLPRRYSPGSSLWIPSPRRPNKAPVRCLLDPAHRRRM